MKKLGILFVFAGLAARAQFLPSIVFDPTNHGVNAANLAQMGQLLQTMTQYRQFYELSQGMFKCPSCFLSAATTAVGAVEGIMIEDGHWDPNDPATARNIANLRKVMALGQMAAQQAQFGQAMSTGNGSSVALLTMQMAQTAQQISTQLQLLQQQARVDYYTHLNGYAPQAAAINSWRLK